MIAGQNHAGAGLMNCWIGGHKIVFWSNLVEFSRIYPGDGVWNRGGKSKIEIKKLCNGDHYFVAWGCRNGGSWNQIFIFFGFTRLYQALPGLTGREPVRNRQS